MNNWVQEQHQNQYFNALSKTYPIEVLYAVNCQRRLQGGDTVNWKTLYEDSAADFENGGFDWSSSSKSSAFWYNVLIQKDFKLFFKEYKVDRYVADADTVSANPYEQTIFNTKATIRACVMCGKLKINPEKYMAELPIYNRSVPL